jgi:hypothetical protein
MTTPDERRGDRRPAWVRTALALGAVFGPVLVPALLLVAVLAFSIGRDAEPRGLGEPPSGLVPGAVTVTDWHRGDTSLVPAGFGRGDPGHASPEALVDTMATDARRAAGGASWITGTVVSERADLATARVYVPLPGDSDVTVAAELMLELVTKPDGWYVDDANVRFHCARAVRLTLCG